MLDEIKANPEITKNITMNDAKIYIYDFYMDYINVRKSIHQLIKILYFFKNSGKILI